MITNKNNKGPELTKEQWAVVAFMKNMLYIQGGKAYAAIMKEDLNPWQKTTLMTVPATAPVLRPYFR